MLKSRRLHDTRAVVERGSAVRATFDGQLRRTCATTQTTNADHKRRRTLQRGIAVVATDYRSCVQFSLPSICNQCSVIRFLRQTTLHLVSLVITRGDVWQTAQTASVAVGFVSGSRRMTGDCLHTNRSHTGVLSSYTHIGGWHLCCKMTLMLPGDTVGDTTNPVC